jgi:hypothetical protein
LNFHGKDIEPEVSNMKTAQDLFLSEEAQEQKARRPFAEILAEDEAELKRLSELADTSISYKRLSRLKATCAWFMLRKRATLVAISIVAAVGVTGVAAPSLLLSDNNAPKSETATAPGLSVEPTIEKTDEAKVSEPKIEETPGTENEVTDKALEAYRKMEGDEQGRLLSKSLDLLPTPVLAPVTEIQIAGNLEKNGAKVPAVPVAKATTITVPVNQVNIHEEAPDDKEPSTSASDLIDQFGFGSEAKEPAETIEESDDQIVSDDIIPVPTAKPEETKTGNDQKIENIRYQIIDRDGEKAGFRRMKDNNPNTTQWFLVVEAVETNGKPVAMPVMNMDTGKVSVVEKWAVQVSEKDFMKYSDQKKKTGKIADTTIGTAPSNTTEPKWSVTLTGNMLTEWD